VRRSATRSTSTSWPSLVRCVFIFYIVLLSVGFTPNTRRASVGGKIPERKVREPEPDEDLDIPDDGGGEDYVLGAHQPIQRLCFHGIEVADACAHHQTTVAIQTMSLTTVVIMCQVQAPYRWFDPSAAPF
jgi:hypothetical protein